jgi:hypothetical protein
VDSLAAQYGALGATLLVAIAAVKVLFNREVEAHKREQERADRLETELKSLNEILRTQVVEKLAASNQVLAEVLTVLRRSP